MANKPSNKPTPAQATPAQATTTPATPATTTPAQAAVAAVQAAPATPAQAARGYAYAYTVLQPNPPMRGLRVQYWAAVAGNTNWQAARAAGGPALSAHFARWLHSKGYIAIAGMPAPVAPAQAAALPPVQA